MGYRQYFSYTLEQLYMDSYRLQPHEYFARLEAKKRLRMYANLYTRGLRKELLTEDSECKECGSKEHLQLDHIIPIMKGGVNDITNIQILCRVCNRLKSDKIL